MFSALRKIIGNISLVQKGSHIVIQGLPADIYMNDIYKIWRTSKIQDYMFTRVTSSSVTFHQFFLPDVLYTIEEVLRNGHRGSNFNYRVLRKVADEIKENTWMKSVYEKQPDILDFSQVNRLDVSPLPHQFDFLETYNDIVPRYNLKGYMLGAVAGSGKTLNSLMLSCCLNADVTICIVPKNSVNNVWEDTIATRFKDPVSYWVSTSKEDPTPGKQYYVFHYEQLTRAIEFFKLHKPSNPLIILDESHNFNEMDSLRTSLLVELGVVVAARNVVWASGTPIKATGNEAIPFLKMIDPFFDENASERFKKIFGKSVSKAVDILRNRIGFLTFKVEKSTVIKNVVEVYNKKVVIPNGEIYTLDVIKEDMRKFVSERMTYYESNMDMYRKRYYDGLAYHEKMIAHDKHKMSAFAIYQTYIAIIRKGYDPVALKMEALYCNKYENKEIIPYLPVELKENFKDAKSVIKYYFLKVQGEALGRILGKKRTECNVAMVPYCNLEEEIDTARKKTVIFTSFVEVVDAAAELLESKGYQPLRVYGATNKDLANIVKRFDSDENLNPLIATYQSLSTAVPLVMASKAIMLNQPFRAHEREQARARIDRIGQDGIVEFIDILLDTDGQPNISTRSNDIMEWSREAVSQIMGKPIDTDNILTLEEFNDCVFKDYFIPKSNTPLYLNW